MYSWNCCRTCLSDRSLYPIFPLPEHTEKYINAINVTAGIKVELNDPLPQEMCSVCIQFINESIKFRRKCEEVQQMLIDNKCKNIKIEPTQNFKQEENATCIDISDSIDDDFKDYDDNITLDTIQLTVVNEEKECNEKIQNENKHEIKFESKEGEIVENANDKIFETKKRKCKRKNGKNIQSKNRSKEKTEKYKEEIECEYCHKILTSKLSLRNHYKIHTGFDVVCEHCGKKFITRRLLLMHCRAKHGYEKTDKCSYCDYKASNAEQVKIHERLHTGEKPFACAQCDARFHRKSSYLQHIAIHLPDKTVQCDQCPARFKSVTLMRIHKSRHRAPRYTYRCGVCGNSFARRRNVARHLRAVHGLPPATDATGRTGTTDEHVQRLVIH